MSLLYKDRKDIKYSLYIGQDSEKVLLSFSSDCGKHGTDELLDSFYLTPKQLLNILQRYDADAEHSKQLKP